MAFSDAQRHELKRCGLQQGEIAALERALPDIAADALDRGPSRANVRKRMKAIRGPLAKAHKALTDLENEVLVDDGRALSGKCIRAGAPEDAVAAFEALSFSDLGPQIHALSFAVLAQERELLVCFSGRRAAPVHVVRGINLLLFSLGADVLPSGQEASRFARIVRVCFSAAELKDPERALSQFESSLRLSEHCMTDQGIRIPEPGEAISRRKAGRPKKPGR